MTTDWMTWCQRLVPEILHQRNWQLVSDLPCFIEKVHQAIIDGVILPKRGSAPKETVRRATIHLYCYEMYQACGEQGSRRQHLAFEEIGQHAQGVAFRYEYNPAVVQECVQQALVILYEKRHHIRNPGSLLRWIESTVYHEIKGYWKKPGQGREVPVSHMISTAETDSNGEDEAVQRFWDSLASVSPPDDEVISQELCEQLWVEVRRVLADNPQQEAVIFGYYLYELSFSTLAEMLRTSVNNVYSIKFRALARLRNDAAFINRFGDRL